MFNSRRLRFATALLMLSGLLAVLLQLGFAAGVGGDFLPAVLCEFDEDIDGEKDFSCDLLAAGGDFVIRLATPRQLTLSRAGIALDEGNPTRFHSRGPPSITL